MNDLPSRPNPLSATRGARAVLSVRGCLRLACAVSAVAAATFVALGIDCAIYLAFSGEPPSLLAVAHQVPQWICGVLRACSA